MVYTIAEIGNNHNGNLDKCLELVKAAADSGASAIKLQSFTGLDIVSPLILSTDYPEWDSKHYEYWYQFLDSIALPLEDHQKVINYTKKLDIDFITTPVSPKIVSFLEKLDGIKAYKVASMDLNNLDLLISLSQTNKPIIISTGMGSLQEISNAVNILSNNKVSILHCISDYPLEPKSAALNNINILKQKYPHNEVGFSDHSLGNQLALVAVSMGAQIIEKHFTLNRDDPNAAEHHFSMEPDEFKEMVNWFHSIDSNLSNNIWSRSKKEEKVSSQYRRSFHYNDNLPKGHIIEKKDLAFVRPGDGISFEDLHRIINCHLKKSVKRFSPCKLYDVE